MIRAMIDNSEKGGAGGLIVAWIGHAARFDTLALVGLVFTALTILTALSREVRGWLDRWEKWRGRRRP
jgi:hypothetical protein